MQQILVDPVSNVCSKNEKLQVKTANIDKSDKEIRKQFAETEKRLRDAGLPQTILNRHHDFVKKYEDNLDKLRKNIDAIALAVTRSGEETAIKNAMEHLNKLNPPEIYKPVNPDKLPHRTV